MLYKKKIDITLHLNWQLRRRTKMLLRYTALKEKTRITLTQHQKSLLLKNRMVQYRIIRRFIARICPKPLVIPYHLLLDSYTPTKSRSLPIFKTAVTIDLSKNRGSLERLAADNSSSFGQLFLIRKSAKNDSPDNNLLI